MSIHKTLVELTELIGIKSPDYCYDKIRIIMRILVCHGTRFVYVQILHKNPPKENESG
jgi:hypothetical protein